MDAVLAAITNLMKRKLLFVMVVGALALAGLFYADGLTAFNVVFAIVLVIFVGLFALLVAFWTAIFNPMRSKR